MNKKYTLLFFVLVYAVFLQAQQINEGAVSQRLITAFDEEPDATQFVYALLSQRVDAMQLQKDFDNARTPVKDRVAILINELKAQAERTQPSFINYLENLDGVVPSTIRPFWITNVVFVEANKKAIAALSNRSDVYWMDINVENALDEAEEIDCALPPSPNGVEAGLAAINAPALWAMGYSGYGQIGFSADTGVDPFHPAIAYKYRGYYADLSETWVAFNEFGNVTGNTTPSNCGDHGTHTVGTMMGLDRNENDTIGVAFNASWVGTAILCGIGTADNIGAFQWALDPDNNPNTIEDMPDAINNSWYDPSLASMGGDCASVYVEALNALETAGIANIFSAGNEGPGAETITTPHNINTDTLNAFTVGALNGNTPTFPISSFSSRGPSICGGIGSLLIKPEVSAPGQSVRSCELDGTYGTKSGTSMAAPHACGAVLLLKEAFPYLTGKDLLRALYHSCTDLGDMGEDNVYGMGIINVLEAFNLLVNQGNVPVSPYVSNDALIVGIPTEEVFCGLDFEAQVVFENAGTEPLTSLQIEYEIMDMDGVTSINSGTIDWTGNLSNKERAEISLPGIGLPNGEYQIIVMLQQPNGVADERPLNDKGVASFIYFAEEDFGVSAIGTQGATSCKFAHTLLYCDYAGEGKINWYTSSVGNLPIAEGSYYLTPPMSFDLTFYAGVKVYKPAGKAELDDQASAIGDSNGRLLLDAEYPFTIRSVTVYADEPGTRTMRLLSTAGSPLAQAEMEIPEAGVHRVEVNMQVPVGVNMWLALQGDPLSYSTEANYPYDIGGLGTIKTSNNSSNPADTWYYYYDWEIEYDFLCGRKPYKVDIDLSSDSPEALFSSSTDVINIANNEAIIFTDESEGADTWLWYFGDGASSTEQNPSHLYTDPGTYLVSLTIVSADGCYDSFKKTITIEALVNVDGPKNLDGQINIYPNPVNDQLYIDYNFKQYQPLALKVLDALGRTIYSLPVRPYTEGKQLLDCSSWPNGLYYIMFTNGEEQLVKKVVRLD